MERFAVKSGNHLRKLNSQGQEIDSKFKYDLLRMPAFQPVEPRLTMNGMFRYMADAATFTECRSGRRWPVAMEGEYKKLETAYLKIRRQPGEELLVSLNGQIGMRPHPDGGALAPALVVERHIGIWPSETC